MTNPTGFDFTKFVPGFDFLKNLTPGNASSASATAPGWVAPTLDPEELEKRIQELKTVQFWLEQNAKAVGATIQALEVQRMTLATLKGMNMSFNDLAESLKVKPQEAAPAAFQYAFTQAEPTQAAPEPEAPKVEPKASKSRSKKAATSGVDPSHWWGALTDQFQHIAAQAMTDMAHRAQAHAATETAAPAAKKTAAKTAVRKSVAPKTAARKTPARKTAAKAKR
ncbi:hypothetical protein B9Z36_12850 [Limnohabitans sp. Rim8]|uniref:PhaM family polyhydroxyalkanoate granule multifunctional regulatory protein n=1 Tax=Limnohabitans sp. Rim8 TaxID=1100718 RepID=UPI000D3B61EE|nr:PhaM family polyhydroxyalkanoate granule multifunctional regulatory protein [Limnohabitans sp. Rim8]PUE54883.1 hypothetical protein B9Z36_12850 [Limnohabitans sp. Rim8]